MTKASEVRKKRIKPPPATVSQILTKAHYRCAVCPSHLRISDIHHIDEDPSNNQEENLIGVCKECHADIHETSTMRRKIAHSDLKILKNKWEERCNEIGTSFSGNIIPHQWLYAHLHRLGPLYKEIQGQNILCVLPHRFRKSKTCLNTLWHNFKSSLGHIEHIELRQGIDECLAEIVKSVNAIDLSLIESGAVNIEDYLGNYVSFTAEFSGKDIPDKEEFVENKGKVLGPPPTLRREVLNDEDPSAHEYIETCLLLDMRYFYSSSAFIHLGEKGRWTGIGLLNSYRSINSANGIHYRSQLNITPLCIASTAMPEKIANGSSVNSLYS